MKKNEQNKKEENKKEELIIPYHTVISALSVLFIINAIVMFCDTVRLIIAGPQMSEVVLNYEAAVVVLIAKCGFNLFTVILTYINLFIVILDEKTRKAKEAGKVEK